MTGDHALRQKNALRARVRARTRRFIGKKSEIKSAYVRKLKSIEQWNHKDFLIPLSTSAVVEKVVQNARLVVEMDCSVVHIRSGRGVR